MTPTHLLVIHDRPAVRRLVADSLGQADVRVSFASSGAEGLALLERERVHVLLAGFDASGVDDEFVRRAASIQPLLAFVLVVDAARAERAAQAKQPGPIRHLVEPVTASSLRLAIQDALDRHVRGGRSRNGDQANLAGGENGQGGSEPAEPIVAASKAMREILELARKCAKTDVSMLICGEPDTGKELIAREVHRHSRRAGAPFVRVACGALRESELAERVFGCREHRPAPEGQPSLSLLEEARGGTLFLENVSQLPAWGQVKLLEVLQQGRCFRTGEDRGAAVDVRVIASSATSLRAAVAQQSFSSSLYHCLSVVRIYVPPLRHRPQDIHPLAQRYLAIANSMRARQEAKAPCRFRQDALECLLEYDWPGNVLQLASVVAHAALLADGEEIGRRELAESLGEIAPRGDADTISVPLAGGLKQMERAIIEAVIERCRGNKAAAARSLKLHRRTLYRILQDETPSPNGAAPPPFILGADGGDRAAVPVAGNGV